MCWERTAAGYPAGPVPARVPADRGGTLGQPITVQPTTVAEVTIFDTDRSITGQDGAGFSRPEALPETPGSIPEDLATRLFAADEAIDHVFVASNVVTAQRSGGWVPEQVDAIAGVIADFFVFYRD